jgi:glycosyltransferase involved in cell wall biosynthesis
MTLRAGIVIPALNEAQSIGRVIDAIPMDDVVDIVVVDNGSSDDTAHAARGHGARVFDESRRGYGAACLRGIASLGPDIDVVVILDADLSDYPDDLPHILEPIRNGRADLVVGSRVLGRAEPGSLPWNQRFGNAIACVLFRWLYGARCTDMGPFRAIRRDRLAALELREPTFGWNVEMLARATILGLTVAEVPVRYRKRIGKSKISGTLKGTIRAGVTIIGTILRHYPAYRRSRRRRSS